MPRPDGVLLCLTFPRTAVRVRGEVEQAARPSPADESSHAKCLTSIRNLALYMKRALRQRPQQLDFRPRQVQPRPPLRRLKHGDLPVVIWRNVRARRGRQHGEALRRIKRVGPDQPSDAEPLCPGQREPPLVLALILRIGWRRELVEMR